MNFLRISNQIGMVSRHNAISRLLTLTNNNSSKLILKPAVLNNFNQFQKRNLSDNGPPEKAVDMAAQILSTDAAGVVSNSSTKLGLLSDAPFTHLAENLLLNLHSLDFLTWPATIFATAFLFRLFICLPIKIYQERLLVRQFFAMGLIDEKVKKLGISNMNKHAIPFMPPELQRKYKNEVSSEITILI